MNDFYTFPGKFDEADFYNSKICKELRSDKTAAFKYDESEGYWQPMTVDALSDYLLSCISPDQIANVQLSQIERVARKIIKDASKYMDFSSLYKKASGLINAKNGVIRIENQKLMEHNPKFGFTYVLDFNYIPNADINTAKAFNDLCRTSLDDSDDAKKLLLQTFGYGLSSLEGAEKMFVYLGPTECGKSVMLNLLENIHGKNNVLSFPLDTITSKNNVAELQHKKINIFRELNGGVLKNVNVLKCIISNERVTGEKKFCSPINFDVHTKLFYAGNALPTLNESDEANEAMLNRICLLRFPHSINSEHKNLQLLDELTLETDIIASAAVNMLKDLRANKYAFHKDPISSEFMKVYYDYSMVLKNFVDDCFQFSPAASVHTASILQAHKKYCKDNGFELTSKDREVSNHIASLPGVKRDKFRLSGTAPLSGFRGIGLKNSSDSLELEQS